MTSPEDVHDALALHEDFAELLENLDSENAGGDIRETVESHGDRTASLFEYDGEELSIEELGWFRLAWEAHHRDERETLIETSQ